MPSPGFSETEQKILFTIWSMKGVGKNSVRQDAVLRRITKTNEPLTLEKNIERLQKLGFVEVVVLDGQNGLSLTPLGISLLRQIEEDQLEELK